MEQGLSISEELQTASGKPDIVLTKYRIAIFCDGEFFMVRLGGFKPRLEKSNNSEFWISKISRNRERDDEINKRLLFEGWTVIRFWGDDIKKHADECVRVVEETIFDMTFDEKKDTNNSKETGIDIEIFIFAGVGMLDLGFQDVDTRLFLLMSLNRNSWIHIAMREEIESISNLCTDIT